MKSRRSITRAVAALAVVAVIAGPAGAQERTAPVTRLPADTLRLADVLAAARATNPMLRAERLRATAAREQVTPAGTLPDPMLELGLMNRSAGSFAAADPMAMNNLQLTQMVPWPGRLGHQRDRARNLATAADLDADEAEQVLLADVRAMYYEIAFMDRAVSVMAGTRQLLRGFLDVSSSMYGVGTGRQQDVLQAQVAVARMTEDITAMTQNRTAMAARLNAMLGREATAAVGALELSVPDSALWPADRLAALAAERRPALVAARERVGAADAATRVARREFYPDLMLSVAYSQRPRFHDMTSLMVGLSVPVWAGRRQAPMLREQEAMRAMEEARALDLGNETFARLVELSAEAERARALSRLYETSVLPQARAAVEASLSVYRVGGADFMTLVESQMTVNRYETLRIRLAADHARAVARIEALLGLAGGAR